MINKGNTGKVVSADTVAFMDEVREQPIALMRFAEQAFQETELEEQLEKVIRERENPHIVLTGMGSSLFACYVTMKFLQKKGIHATVMESMELLNMHVSFFAKDVIVVAVSQSGESLEVLKLLQELPGDIPVISVTNYPKSHLYGMTELHFGIYAGTEYLTSTKTYTNTLAAMLLLAYRIAGCSGEEKEKLRRQLEVCSAGMEKIIGEEHLGDEIADFISDISFLICVGGGYSYTTTCHSEIVAEEAGKFYSSRYTPAQFIHGPIELIAPGFGAVLYDFDPDCSAKCDEVRENILHYGGKVLCITNRKDIASRENQLVYVIEHEDPATAVLLEIIPLELGIDSLCKKRGTAAGHLSRVVKRIAN